MTRKKRMKTRVRVFSPFATPIIINSDALRFLKMPMSTVYRIEKTTKGAKKWA